MTTHVELIAECRDFDTSLFRDVAHANAGMTAKLQDAADALESQARELEARERLFWDACSKYGKTGEAIYMTYKTRRDAAMAAKGDPG